MTLDKRAHFFAGFGSPDLKDALATLLGASVAIPAFFI